MLCGVSPVSPLHKQLLSSHSTEKRGLISSAGSNALPSCLLLVQGLLYRNLASGI